MDFGRHAAHLLGLFAATAQTTISRVVWRSLPSPTTATTSVDIVQTSLLENLFNNLVLPLLTTVVFAFALVFLFILLLNYTRIARSVQIRGKALRERYDDFTLNNHVLLTLEHAWASFKRSISDLYLSLRYTQTMDKVVWAGYQIYFFPARVQRGMGRHWGKILLGLALLGWLRCAWVRKERRVEVPFHLLPTNLTSGQPGWVTNYWVGKKKEESNSHHGRSPETLALDDNWAQARGSDPWINNLHPLTATSTQTITVQMKPRTSLITLTIEAHPQTTTKTIVSTSTSVQIMTKTEGAVAGAETDYWKPKRKKTNVEGHGMVWCRECQQFHCCELPY
jgi:hypothetical protein